MPAKGFKIPDTVNPIQGAIHSGEGNVLHVPDIIEFTVSDEYLNRPNLYPRQATLLKTIFLQEELFTPYDYAVLDEWSQGFSLNATGESDGVWRYQGDNGIQPDILERMHINREAGRKWFRECVVVLGRRGGKGYIGAICGAYVLWNFMAKGDPQAHYGVARDKRLSGLVFAGKLNQAKTEQFKDLTDIITGSNCFAPYISKPQAESFTVWAPDDAKRIKELEYKGIKTDADLATFELKPKEATMMAGRGPASFLQYYDEMAHVSTSSGASASAETVYGAATPSLDQFGKDAFIYEGSSPYQMMGQFYENWKHSLEVDPRTQRPIYPEIFMVQLESWAIYKDWEKASGLKMRKGFKRHFNPLKRAMQEYDAEMERLERANPETFAVERRSRWAASMDAYLNPIRIRAMWAPYDGQQLVMQTKGRLNTHYSAHVDPSKSGANTGLAVAHVVPPGPGEEFSHVVFDLIKHWQPGDFPENDNEIDYIVLQKWIEENVIDAFMPGELTFDQFDASIIQRVRRYAQNQPHPKVTQVYERTATKQINWKMAECFKTALGLGLLHAPYYEQAENEMLYLQDVGHERVDHPTEGPIQTKDVWDAMANVTYALIGAEMMSFLGQEFSDFGVVGALPGGIQPFSEQFAGDPNEASNLFSAFGNVSARQREQMSTMSPARSMNRDRPRRWSPSSPWTSGRYR